MYLHTVAFRLQHPPGSPQEQAFLAAATAALAPIPTVRKMTQYRQVSAKNDLTFTFAFEFDSKADWQAYTAHPDHAQFVRTYWATQVERFQETDYAPL